ncbi:MAG: 4Fe-4S binding protein [Methanobrevibacter sp.]|nr:4Fe-4S binding protein [Methanobrevibacter sp.]
MAVDKDKCTGCGECKEICPKGQKIWTINKIAHASNLEYCHVCTICASRCPEDAITVIRNAPDDEEEKKLLKEIKEDKEEKLPL